MIGLKIDGWVCLVCFIKEFKFMNLFLLFVVIIVGEVEGVLFLLFIVVFFIDVGLLVDFVKLLGD